MTSQVAITLLKSLEQSLDSYCGLNDEGKTAFSMAISALELFGNSEQLPSVQPRKGKWDCFTEDINGLSFGIKRCSMCGASKPMKLFHWEDTEINFCPNCGADMREGDAE